MISALTYISPLSYGFRPGRDCHDAVSQESRIVTLELPSASAQNKDMNYGSAENKRAPQRCILRGIRAFGLARRKGSVARDVCLGEGMQSFHLGGEAPPYSMLYACEAPVLCTTNNKYPWDCATKALKRGCEYAWCKRSA